MRILNAIILLTLFFMSQLKAQLTTTQTLTPQQLVQNVLLGGGVTATNITFSGDPLQIAKFTATSSTSLGLSGGVLISSGNALTSNVNGPQGPNNSTGTTTSFNNVGDPDLDIISGNPTYDAAILEFDFVPTGDSLKFRYFFGSEEYPEFVNAGYNDAFGFFLTGPNPSGGNYTDKNIALIPGSSTAVSINNVNATTNNSFYRSNTGNTINSEFDGFTSVLYALEKIICGQSYHIKIAIADGGDAPPNEDYTYDSGVFLEGGSFSSSPPLSLNTTNANSNIPDTLLIEDCNSNCINFIRNGNIANVDSFSIQVSGNALLGTDFIQAGNPGFAWPTKLIFAANQDTIKICNLTAFQDGLSEALDTIKFTMTSFITNTLSCASSNTIKFNLYIKDYTPISIGQTNLSVCNGSFAILNAKAGNGYPTYTYSLSLPTVNTATLNTGPINSTTTFTITVNDVCNKPITKQIIVTPVAIPNVVSDDASICFGEIANLTALGASTYTWNTGVANSVLTIGPPSTTSYTVVGAIGNCTNSAVGTVTVTGQAISFSGNNNICIGQSSVLSASGGSVYTWNTGSTSSVITVTPTSNTSYTVTSTHASCTNTAVYTVSVSQIPIITVTETVVCPGQNAVLTATGATTYTWNTGQNSSSINISPLINTTYTVIGTTVVSCTNTAVSTVTVITSKPEIQTINPVIFCLDSTKKIPVTISSGSPPYSLTWSIPVNGIIPYDTLNTTYYFTQSITPSNENYTIMVTDQCLFQDSVVLNIESRDCNVIIPNVVTPNGDNVNEYFKINGLDYFPKSSLVVFNRWGAKIYTSNDYKNDWNPNVNSGTYFYVLNVADGRKYNGFFQVFTD